MRSWQPGLEATWAAGLKGHEVKVRGVNHQRTALPGARGQCGRLEVPSQSRMALGTPEGTRPGQSTSSYPATKAACVQTLAAGQSPALPFPPKPPCHEPSLQLSVRDKP